MAKIGTHFAEIGMMDQASAMDSPIHRIDPRAKLLTTLAYIVTVVSYGKYDISALLPFAIYPIVLASIGNIPPQYLIKRIILVSPFAIMIGVFNPIMDHSPMLAIGTVTISGGWISFASIIVRFILTVGAALVLLACTGIHEICYALERLGTPRVFTIQLLFLYRYLFVLMDEGIRMVRARAVRSFGQHGMGITTYGHMLGHLLLRSLDRAQRIHSAMSSRGFDGRIRLSVQKQFTIHDMAFLSLWLLAFTGMRLFNIPNILGSLVTGVFK